MKQQFYSLPFEFGQVIHKKEPARCSLQVSVTQYVHLLLTTAFGELPGDETFGCSIWDNDFDIVTSGHSLREYLRQSIVETIKKHEKRIFNIRVELGVFQQQLFEINKARQVKKRMDISVTGSFHSTNEKFNHTYSFFIGPLSY